MSDIPNILNLFFKFFRRKVREAISRTFPEIPKETLMSLLPNKEEMSVMKLLTHSDKNVTCYCLQKNPIFFEVDGLIFPTGNDFLTILSLFN